MSLSLSISVKCFSEPVKGDSALDRNKGVSALEIRVRCKTIAILLIKGD